jgi:hypothetical protein
MTSQRTLSDSRGTPEGHPFVNPQVSATPTAPPLIRGAGCRSVPRLSVLTTRGSGWDFAVPR